MWETHKGQNKPADPHKRHLHLESESRPSNAGFPTGTGGPLFRFYCPCSCHFEEMPLQSRARNVAD